MDYASFIDYTFSLTRDILRSVFQDQSEESIDSALTLFDYALLNLTRLEGDLPHQFIGQFHDAKNNVQVRLVLLVLYPGGYFLD